MTEVEDTLLYGRGTADPKALDAEARAIWSGLLSKGQLEQMLRDEGVEFDTGLEAFPFLIEEGSAGIVVGGTTLAVVVIAPVAKEALRDIWRKILLPYLLRRLGSDALGPEKVRKKAKKRDDASGQ